jgi:hypothetical protein
MKFKEILTESNVGDIENVKGVNNEALCSLVMYMIDHGIKVEPFPKVRVIDDDEKNAEKLLGDTGNYDNEKKIITLYTLKRHPEDVLRSFCHEMIHHVQNLEGRIGHSDTENVNKDTELEQLESEANRRGTMIFRAWKDEQTERK